MPLIDSSTFSGYGKPNDLRRQVRDWLIKGYLVSLKKGLYVFSEEYRKIQPLNLFIANFLVAPSYVSLEYALAFYELIPERVGVITSVTTKKTKVFKNVFGRYEYHSVKESLFFGYKKIKLEGNNVFVALPEKALVDYFYLNPDAKADFSYFDSLRLQNLDAMNTESLKSVALKIKNRRVTKITQKLLLYREEHKKRLKTL